MSSADQPGGDLVELRVPADGRYVAFLRTVTAALATRCDLTLDDIEDLRIAVDEACALLLPHATPGSTLQARYSLTTGCLEVVAAVPTADDGVDRGGFAWTLLQALATSVTVSRDDDGQLLIALVKQRDQHTR